MQYTNTFFLIIVVAAFLLFVKLGTITVFQVAEARNSQAPVEMRSRHNYIVPFFNGVLRVDKPPLHYYAMLLAYSIGGVNETSARFLSAVCGILVIAATWLFANRYAGSAVAWWSSVVLLASIHTIFQFRLATPDPFLITCHVLSLYCFWEGYQQQKKWFIRCMYALLGLAILAKGLVGLALPAITIDLYLLFQKEFSFKNIWKLQPVTGIIIMAAIALPWFYTVHIQTNGAWTQGFFIQHNVNRFNEPMDGHKGPFIVTWGFVIMGLFPFSIFMIRALVFAWKQRKANNWLFFNLIAAAVIVLMYSISATKLLNYTTPAYPFLAVITGAFIFYSIQGKTTTHKLWPEWIALSVFSMALPPVMYFWMQSEKAMQVIAPLSRLLLVFPVTIWWGMYHYKKGRIKPAFSIIAWGAIIVNGIFFTILFPALDARGSVHQLKTLVQTNRPVIAWRTFNDAFIFYHGQPIAVINSADSVARFLQQHPAGLVLERATEPHLTDSVEGLVVKASGKDLFSHQYSFVYELKKHPKKHH